MVLCEFCQILVNIEDDGDGDDEYDREDISPDKLLDDIPVKTLEVPAGSSQRRKATVS